MTMTKSSPPTKDKYKRKFLVQGDTPNTRSLFKNYCQEDCQKSVPWIQRCRGIGGLFPPYEECKHKDKLFNEYIVSETVDGEWQCSCKAWTTHLPRKDCKHVRKAKANPEKYEISKDFTGTSVDILKKVFS